MWKEQRIARVPDNFEPLAHDNYRWVILTVVTVSMITYGLIHQSVPPVITLIISDLSLSHAQAGALIGALAIPGIFIALPAGLLISRFGSRLVGAAAFGFMSLGALITALSPSFAILLIGRLISGCGAMTLSVLLAQLLGQWFHGRRVGMAMAIYQTGFPLGVILAFNVFSYLGAAFDWHTALLGGVGAAVVTGLLFVGLARPSPYTPAPAGRAISWSSDGLSILRRCWPPIAAWAWMQATMVSLFTFTPDLLVEQGWTVSAAGRAVSMVLWPCLIGSPIVGYLVDRTQWKLPFILAGSAMAILAIGAIATGLLPVWSSMLLLGFGISALPGTLYAMPNDLAPPQGLPIAFGLMTMFQNVGVTFGPYVAGQMKDLTGAYTWTYVLIMAFMLMAPLSALGVIPVRRQLRKGTLA